MPTYHEVETGHEQDKVDQQQPVALKRDLTLGHEGCSDTTTHLGTRLLTTTESLRLGQTQTERDDQQRRASSEPVQRTPAMRGCIDETARKGRREQIPKSITLLQQTRDNTTCFGRAILERSSRSVTVQTTHGDAKDSAAGQELLVGLTETTTELDGDEKQLVDDKGPLTTIPIRGNTKDNGTDGSQHQHEGDTPGDVGDGFVKGLGQLGGGQGDGEEVECIPGPAAKGDLHEGG